MFRIRMFLFLCALACAGAASTASAAERLVVYEAYPPYEMLDRDGVITGIHIDMAREAFRRMGDSVKFEARPWRRALQDIRTGDAFAASSGFRIPEREEYAFYPDEPLSDEVTVIAANKVSGVEVNSLEDLRGLTVGVVSGYVYGHGFEELDGLKKEYSNSNDLLLKKLFNFRVDVIIGNRDVLRYLTREQDRSAHIRFVYEVGRQPLYLFFSKAFGMEAKRAAERFSEAIREMRRDGTVDRILRKY